MKLTLTDMWIHN